MVLKIDKFIIILLLLFGQNVLGFFGVSLNLFQAGILALCFIPLFYFRKSLYQIKSLTILLIFVSVFATYRLLSDQGEGTRQLALTILGAPMVIAAIPNPTYYNGKKNYDFWKTIVIILFYAYLLDTSLAIFERLIGHNVFGWQGEEDAISFSVSEQGATDFRSTSIYGHPLSNVLMVSTAMAFLLVSKLKITLKLLLWVIGFLSILCFNSRSGIVGNILFLVVFLIHTFFLNRHMNSSLKVKLLWSVFVVLIVVYILVFNYGLGGRLLEMGLFDENSSMVRINAWDILDYYDIEQFLFSHSLEENMALRYSAGLYRLENFWLNYMLSCGLIFLLIYSFLYFFVYKFFLRNYSLFNKCYVSFAFLSIASTSNSLDSNFLFLFYFILLSIVNDPFVFEKIVDKHYLSK
jgi:hypothetical protein